MSKVSVLVVDDATFIRDLVKKGLRDNFPGVQIEEAINGRKAQQMLSRQVVDLILCDWEMPEMSGLELLTWCREQDNLKTTPFIMVTSRGDKENVVQAIQAGVSDYIGKPFSNEQLVTKVKKALQRAGKLQALMSSAPSKMLSTGGFANDSLAALTGGKAEVVKTSAPAFASGQYGLRDQGAEPQGGTAGGQAHQAAAAGAGECSARPGTGRSSGNRTAQWLPARSGGIRTQTRQRMAATDLSLRRPRSAEARLPVAADRPWHRAEAFQSRRVVHHSDYLYLLEGSGWRGSPGAVPAPSSATHCLGVRRYLPR